MTLDALIMLAGVMVTLVPFLGFPLKWDNVILVVLGVLVITLGIIVRRRGLVRRSAIQTDTVTSHGVPRAAEETHATE
jgi:hypothetical protein